MLAITVPLPTRPGVTGSGSFDVGRLGGGSSATATVTHSGPYLAFKDETLFEVRLSILENSGTENVFPEHPTNVDAGQSPSVDRASSAAGGH